MSAKMQGRKLGLSANQDSAFLFGAQVWKHRTRLGWTQQKLAEKSGLHLTYISGIERGLRNVSLFTINTLARALKIPVDALLSDNGKPIGIPAAFDQGDRADGPEQTRDDRTHTDKDDRTDHRRRNAKRKTKIMGGVLYFVVLGLLKRKPMDREQLINALARAEIYGSIINKAGLVTAMRDMRKQGWISKERTKFANQPPCFSITTAGRERLPAIADTWRNLDAAFRKLRTMPLPPGRKTSSNGGDTGFVNVFLRERHEHAILILLNRGPLYGCQIVKAMALADRRILAPKWRGSVYAAIDYMRVKGWITVKWMSKSLKRCSITAEGREMLRKKTAMWRRLTKVVDHIIQESRIMDGSPANGRRSASDANGSTTRSRPKVENT